MVWSYIVIFRAILAPSVTKLTLLYTLLMTLVYAPPIRRLHSIGWNFISLLFSFYILHSKCIAILSISSRFII